MKVAIMQPYFFPYIGYFQLINAVDIFVIYDSIEFSKKGWINRNRILVNNKDYVFTLPLKKDSDFLNVDERFLSDNWNSDKIKLLNKIKEAYRKAPFYNDVIVILEDALNYEDKNLFDFIKNSLIKVLDYLEIKTKIIQSSEVDFDNSLKNQDKVIAICNALKAKTYINPIGGLELYDKEVFKASGIELQFLKANPITYQQYGDEFVMFLSIIDVMMFNSVEDIKKFITNEFQIL